MKIETAQQARAALKALGMTQLEMAQDLQRITGGKYHPQAVNRWFTDRGPSDICMVYLTLKLEARIPVIAREKADTETEG